MQKLWNDIIHEPVVMLTIFVSALTAAQEAINVGWFTTLSVGLIAVSGGITRHYTHSRLHVRETYGAKEIDGSGYSHKDLGEGGWALVTVIISMMVVLLVIVLILNVLSDLS